MTELAQLHVRFNVQSIGCDNAVNYHILKQKDRIMFEIKVKCSYADPHDCNATATPRRRANTATVRRTCATTWGRTHLLARREKDLADLVLQRRPHRVLPITFTICDEHGRVLREMLGFFPAVPHGPTRQHLKASAPSRHEQLLSLLDQRLVVHVPRPILERVSHRHHGVQCLR
jgi:hypothetical protein